MVNNECEISGDFRLSASVGVPTINMTRVIQYNKCIPDKTALASAIYNINPTQAHLSICFVFKSVLERHSFPSVFPNRTAFSMVCILDLCVLHKSRITELKTGIEFFHSQTARCRSRIPTPFWAPASLSLSTVRFIFNRVGWPHTTHHPPRWTSRHPLFTRPVEITSKDSRRLSQEPSESFIPNPYMASQRGGK